MKKMRLFQKSATGILVLFFGLMFFVTYKAYSRKSGATGLDMARVQQMLAEENRKAKQIAEQKRNEARTGKLQG